jgi:hypothetical protein
MQFALCAIANVDEIGFFSHAAFVMPQDRTAK